MNFLPSDAKSKMESEIFVIPDFNVLPKNNAHLNHQLQSKKGDIYENFEAIFLEKEVKSIGEQIEKIEEELRVLYKDKKSPLNETRVDEILASIENKMISGRMDKFSQKQLKYFAQHPISCLIVGYFDDPDSIVKICRKGSEK